MRIFSFMAFLAAALITVPIGTSIASAASGITAFKSLAPKQSDASANQTGPGALVVQVGGAPKSAHRAKRKVAKRIHKADGEAYPACRKRVAGKRVQKREWQSVSISGSRKRIHKRVAKRIQKRVAKRIHKRVAKRIHKRIASVFTSGSRSTSGSQSGSTSGSQSVSTSGSQSASRSGSRSAFTSALQSASRSGLRSVFTSASRSAFKSAKRIVAKKLIKRKAAYRIKKRLKQNRHKKWAGKKKVQLAHFKGKKPSYLGKKPEEQKAVCFAVKGIGNKAKTRR